LIDQIIMKSSFSAWKRQMSTKNYPKTFDKLLVANRGEIARRIFSTCKKMGIKTVAVYSDADRHAMFVKEADEAYRIGPPATAESYLLMDTILDVAKQSGSNAVHPGYGFLAERAIFPQACNELGMTFVGPPASAIEQMGDKIMSKKVAREAKVNTIPGYMGEIKNIAECKKISNEIGYPVMIKASAGGGGKGMRIAVSLKQIYLISQILPFFNNQSHFNFYD
jgi:propionyl-CoA carboxylase alpha chain